MAGAIERRSGLPGKQEGILGDPALRGKDRLTIIDRLWQVLIGKKRKQWTEPEASPPAFQPRGGTPEEQAAAAERLRKAQADLEASDAVMAKKRAAQQYLGK
jgi:hypothetical protein